VTAEPPEDPVTEEVRSLEVRWIFPGQLQTTVAGWFGRFPARVESREDTYLLDPPLPGLSVKVRGGRALEVKAYRGSPGILEATGRARGRLEAWHKWSFPASPPGPNRVTDSREGCPERLGGSDVSAEGRRPAAPAPEGDAHEVHDPGVRLAAGLRRLGRQAGSWRARLERADFAALGQLMEQFARNLAESGELVDTRGLTAPSQARRIRLAGGAPVVTDGPYAEAEEVLAGYWIVECESLDRATDIATRLGSAVCGLDGELIEVRKARMAIGLALPRPCLASCAHGVGGRKPIPRWGPWPLAWGACREERCAFGRELEPDWA
jgi:hypothetical protein